MPREHDKPGKSSSIVRDKEWLEASTLNVSREKRSRSRSSSITHSVEELSSDGDSTTLANADADGESGRACSRRSPEDQKHYYGHSGGQRIAETHKRVAAQELKRKAVLRRRNMKEGKDVILKERELKLVEKKQETIK